MATQEVLNPHLGLRAKSKGHPALVLAAACCGVFVGFGSLLVFTFGVFLKPLANAFGWSRAEVSFAFTIAALMVAASSPYIGRLLDRYPPRRIILPCTVIYALAFASLGLLTRHYAHLIAVFVVLGIVGNGTAHLAYARVVSVWFDRSRGRALAAIMAGAGAGSMIFPPLAQALITAYGWRITYGTLGGVIVLLGLPLSAAFLHEPDNRMGEQPHPGRPASRESIWKDIRSVPFLALVSGLVLFSLATNGLYEHWSALLTDRGLNAQLAATVLSVAGVASITSRLITGYLLDRFFAGRVAASLFGICAAGFLLMLCWHTAWSAFISAVLVGLGLGAEADSVPYLLTRYFGLARFGELYGYTWTLYAIAGAFGPLLMGGIFDRTGSYTSALILFLAIVVVAALLFAALPRYPRRT